MSESISITSNLSLGIQPLAIGTLAILIAVALRFSWPGLRSLLEATFTASTTEIYQTIVAPYQKFFRIVATLLLAEILAMSLPTNPWTTLIEISISLVLIGLIGWLLSRFFKRFFDAYLLEIALKNGRKTNSELLVLARFLANLVIVVIGVTIFAGIHQVNIVGLIASLGIGGLAIAFAAQKTLEQLLGGIVIYLDRPFVVDDYIGLPDGVFGRVETIGLRSTKIRTSGKGTLVIVPNSALTQVMVENFTGAKKVMALIYLNFQTQILQEEQAFIHQLILESTKDIFGIDAQNTDVLFQNNPAADQRQYTQAQITFFILGSGEVSMELRRQLLDIANQNIAQQLKDYQIDFEIEEPTIYVNAPITI